MSKTPDIEAPSAAEERPGQDPLREYEIARDAARAARQAAGEAVNPEARFFLKRHADLLERIAATRRRGLAGRGVPIASAGSAAVMAIFG